MKLQEISIKSDNSFPSLTCHQRGEGAAYNYSVAISKGKEGKIRSDQPVRFGYASHYELEVYVVGLYKLHTMYECFDVM